MPKRKTFTAFAPAAAMAAKRAKKAYRPSMYKKRAIARISNARTGGFLGLEKKFVDYEYDAAVVQTVASAEADPATALCLNVSAQGDGPSEHDGRQAVIKSIEIRGTVLFSGTDAATPAESGYVRILVLLDKQTNGAQFNSEDVLKDPTDADLDSDAMRNLEFIERFQVLRDMTIHSGDRSSIWDGTSAPTEATYKPFKIFIPLKNLVCNFTSTTAAIANVKDNSIHVMAIGEGGAAILRYVSRCRFFG